MAALEQSAAQWLQPYPNAGTRENLKEFLVSGVLILSIFSFFIQPMKIPPAPPSRRSTQRRPGRHRRPGRRLSGPPRTLCGLVPRH